MFLKIWLNAKKISKLNFDLKNLALERKALSKDKNVPSIHILRGQFVVFKIVFFKWNLIKFNPANRRRLILKWNLFKRTKYSCVQAKLVKYRGEADEARSLIGGTAQNLHFLGISR
jgi:hypothetical protein